MFKDSFGGLNGFEELKKYIKQGVDLSREIHSVLNERATLEAEYAKALSKLGNKLTKITSANIGSLAEAWGFAGAEMETEAELHKQFAQGLHDDICKVIKNFMDSQAKSRKPIEAAVEKSVKNLVERRNEENKLKKASHSCAREFDKTAELLSQSNKEGKVKDKELAKLDKKQKQLEETFRKGDREYYDCCKKAEVAREEWESQLTKACSQLQQMEEERIAQLQDSLSRYNSHQSVLGPKLTQISERVREAVLSIDCAADIHRVVTQKQTGPNQPEQILPEFYAEDKRNQMDKEGRRQALQNYLLFIQQDLEKENSSREGVEKLLEVYRNRPTYGDEDTQSETLQRLTHINAMLRYLEASHSKIAIALAEAEGSAAPQASKLITYIERSKDKQGHNVSILRVPQSMIKESITNLSLPEAAAARTPSSFRPPADGGQSQPEESSRRNTLGGGSMKQKAPPPPRQSFRGSGRRSIRTVSSVNRMSSFGSFSDEEFDASSICPIARCTAIYHYKAVQADELTIEPGDIIHVYEKQADGWWQGELRGRVGVFPATYVRDM